LLTSNPYRKAIQDAYVKFCIKSQTPKENEIIAKDTFQKKALHDADQRWTHYLCLLFKVIEHRGMPVYVPNKVECG
jgi:hypothetical protein